MSEVWNEKGVKPIFYFKITGFCVETQTWHSKFSSKKKSLETGRSKEENRIQTWWERGEEQGLIRWPKTGQQSW